MGLLPLHQVDATVALGLTKGTLQPVIHVDADLQVKVGPVSRKDHVGPVSRELQVAAVEEIEENETSDEQRAQDAHDYGNEVHRG